MESQTRLRGLCRAIFRVKTFVVIMHASLCFGLGCGRVSFGQYSRSALAGAASADQENENGKAPESSDQAEDLETAGRQSRDALGFNNALEVKCPAALSPQSFFESARSATVAKEKFTFESRPQSLNIPGLCSWNETVVFSPVQNLKVWLVLDVSGSMRPNIDTVRKGIADLLEIYKEKGWQLEVGAIAFTDSIDAIIPPTKDIDELLKMTSDDVSAWKVFPNRGQDTPESGLAAIGCALSMAYLGKNTCSKADVEAAELGTLPTQLGKQTTVLDSHWIIYVSDAPARNSAFAFDALRLSQSLHDLADRIYKSGAELRFYAATKDDHKGLLPHWPVPLEQLQEIVKLGQVPFQEMRFPVTEANVEKTFLAQARITPNEERSHQCELEEIGQVDPGGMKFNVIRLSESYESSVVFQAVKGVGADSAPSETQVYIQRKCRESGMRTFERVEI